MLFRALSSVSHSMRRKHNVAQTILYVEDNPNNMLLVKRIVQAEGHHLLEATDGVSGWQTAVAHQPDLILMDLHLPGDLDGLTLTQKIKQQPALSHIPIVALTAHGNAAVEKAALAAGCTGFLHKPADIRQIRAMLHKYLADATVRIPATQPALRRQFTSI